MITLIVLLLSITFASLTLAIFSFGNSVDQTSLGFIYLGDSEEEQYSSVINNQIVSWKANADYRIQYQDYTFAIDLSMIDLDLEKTLSHIEKDQENQAYFEVSNDNYLAIQNDIETEFTDAVITTFDMDSFITRLLIDVSELRNRKVYELSEFLAPQLASAVLHEVQVNQILADDVNQVIAEVQTFAIDANSRFSLLEKLGDLSLTNEQLSIIASALQAVSLETHFNGFIFEQNYTLPSWALSGQNVRILRVNEFDFTFFNQCDMNYEVSIEKVNATTLNFKLIGYPFITTYETTSVFQVAIPFQTIYVQDDDLDEFTPGVIITETDTEYIYQLLIQAGVPGQVTFYMRSGTRPGGIVTTTRLFDEQMLPTQAIYYQNIVDKVVI